MRNERSERPGNIPPPPNYSVSVTACEGTLGETDNDTRSVFASRIHTPLFAALAPGLLFIEEYRFACRLGAVPFEFVIAPKRLLLFIE